MQMMWHFLFRLKNVRLLNHSGFPKTLKSKKTRLYYANQLIDFKTKRIK